jgi:hypothetical protein
MRSRHPRSPRHNDRLDVVLAPTLARRQAADIRQCFISTPYCTLEAEQTRTDSKSKDERALSVSGYVYRGNVKYTDYAFNKTTVYKRKSRNHLGDQIESFRIGDKDNQREDDLLDTFCYGIALALGDGSGF